MEALCTFSHLVVYYPADNTVKFPFYASLHRINGKWGIHKHILLKFGSMACTKILWQYGLLDCNAM